jgi:DNA-binding GntR family transcriptional regulator
MSGSSRSPSSAGRKAASLSGTASLREQVYRQLEDAILSGRYAPGENLTECAIAETLGVSRTPVREAIRQLDQEGLVDFVPNKGAVVKVLSEDDVRDIGEIRTNIEGIAARRAATAIKPEQLAALEALIREEISQTSRGAVDQLTQIDSRFHEIIFEASGSRLLNRTLRSFHHAIRQARHLSLRGAHRAEKTLAEHQALLDALRAGDARQAEALMVRHVRNATRNIQQTRHKSNGSYGAKP